MQEATDPPPEDGSPPRVPLQVGRSRPVSVEEALQNAELRLRAIFDHTFHFMGVLTPEGDVLEVNRAALEFGGLSIEEVVGRRFWETGWWQADPVEQERLRAGLAAAANGEFVRYEAELTGVDATPRTLDLSLKPVRDAQGEVVFLIAEARDISETKWAERALRVSEARFAGMIAISSEAIVSVDESFTITLFNGGAEAIFGYTADEVLGQPLDMLLPLGARGGHAQHMQHFAASPVAARRMGERQEITGRRRDGVEFPAEASISKLDLFGSMIFTVVLRDITERKRVERSQRFLAQAGAILASSLDYRETLASVAGLMVPELADWSIIYLRETDGSLRRLEVAHADPARQPLVRALLGYPLDRRTPHPAFAVMETGRPEIMAEVSEEFRRAISANDEQLDLYRQLGLESFVVVPLVAHGEIRGAMGCFSGRSHRYGPDEVALVQELALMSALAVVNARLYRDARQAIQARDDMMAVVSHDLGNPLSAIRIGTSLLLRTMPEGDAEYSGRQHVDAIRQSARQMENLVNDLLDVQRLESGSLPVDASSVEAAAVVRDVVEVLRPIAESRSIRLETQCGAELPLIDADYRRLVQVLSNLIGNAIKFTDSGGAVVVRAEAVEGFVRFSVKDTGCGIAPEHLPHVFDRFWQVRRGGRAGLGLGLAIARGIVDAHGGQIWAESTVGVGCNFQFTIPSGPPARG